jgi:hypothetical protein
MLIIRPGVVAVRGFAGRYFPVRRQRFEALRKALYGFKVR